MSHRNLSQKRLLSDKKLAIYTETAPARVHTLEEIAMIMGITRERVRQIESQALKKLYFHFTKLYKSDNISKEDFLSILASVDNG